jgi:ribosomal-protein-alanine N-acetyltransferase
MKYEINTSVFNNFPNLLTDRTILREFDLRDSLSLYKLRSNSEVMKYLDRPYMKSIVEAQEMINQIHESFQKREGISWAIVERSTGLFMGYIGFWRMDKANCRAEVGYMLLPEFHGKGFMSEVLLKVVKFGFDELHLHSIEANCNPENISSIKLLEKRGFKKEAYFRENYLFNNKFLDSVIYCLLKEDLS